MVVVLEEDKIRHTKEFNAKTYLAPKWMRNGRDELGSPRIPYDKYPNYEWYSYHAIRNQMRSQRAKLSCELSSQE